MRSRVRASARTWFLFFLAAVAAAVLVYAQHRDELEAGGRRPPRPRGAAPAPAPTGGDEVDIEVVHEATPLAPARPR